MRYLFDILHPAHVHVLKHPRSMLLERGHDVVVTSRRKDIATDLLDALGIDHTVISEQKPGSAALARELVKRSTALRRIVKDERIDAMVGLMGPAIAPVGKLTGIPSFVLYDTEVAKRTNSWVYPLATEVITPDCYANTVRGNHVTYAGYHELAYLHPNRFTPDRGRIASFGVTGERPYVFVRLPSLDSSHDGAEQKTPASQWLDWFQAVGQTHDIVVSSESRLPSGFDQYVVSGDPLEVHHVLAHADVVVGESATMAAEAAVLGTPAVFVGATSRGYVDDIESRYSLIRRFHPSRFEDAIDEADALIADPARGEWAAEARNRLLAEHIDVSAWLTDHLADAIGSP